jgi:hypothetical protein
VSFALQTAMDEGHCGLPIDQLTGLAERLLEVDAELLEYDRRHQARPASRPRPTIEILACDDRGGS